jgi:hypothetical protein
MKKHHVIALIVLALVILWLFASNTGKGILQSLGVGTGGGGTASGGGVVQRATAAAQNAARTLFGTNQQSSPQASSGFQLPTFNFGQSGTNAASGDFFNGNYGSDYAPDLASPDQSFGDIPAEINGVPVDPNSGDPSGSDDGSGNFSGGSTGDEGDDGGIGDFSGGNSGDDGQTPDFPPDFGDDGGGDFGDDGGDF